MSKTVSLTMCCGQLSFDGVSSYEQALQNRDIRVVGDTSYVIPHNSVVMMTAQPKIALNESYAASTENDYPVLD